jgi:coenzyme F420-reducing hydrogenase delta subunit/Fe-S-cluster-containing hydrogenase component 2
MAGVSRLQYATDIELIRVMCSGRVDLEFVFRAFAKGMDGVFIGGCRLNECNYTTHGNYHALNMALLCKKILSHLGLNPDRLMVGFMSSGEGNLFAEAVNDFSRNVASLGPLGSSEGLSRKELDLKLQEVRKLIPYIKIAKKEKLEIRLENEEEYESFYTADEIERLFAEIPTFQIDPDKCQACMICLRKCPVQAIEGGKGQVHFIDQEKCIKCGTCFEACPSRFSAVQKTSAAKVHPPGPGEESGVQTMGK